MEFLQKINFNDGVYRKKPTSTMEFSQKINFNDAVFTKKKSAITIEFLQKIQP